MSTFGRTEGGILEFEGRHKPRPKSVLLLRDASEINLENVEWLWPGKLARGKHTCIAGDPGTGKSQLAISIMATLTMGASWPCGEGQAPLGSAILFSAEDGAGDTILPRLHAAGADCGRIRIVEAMVDKSGEHRTFNLREDLTALEEAIEDDTVLVVFDTVNSYLGKTDSHKNAEVRAVLDPLSKMAERKNVAVLSVTHFSKGGSGSATKALHRFLGSIGFVGSPRAAFATFEDPTDPDRRLFLHAKNNLAPAPQGLSYSLEQIEVGPEREITTSRVRWDTEPVRITANEAMAADGSSAQHRNASGEAESFLSEILSDGPMSANDVKAETESAGLSWATVRRAKDQLGIKPRKAAMDGGWLWELPQTRNPVTRA